MRPDKSRVLSRDLALAAVLVLASTGMARADPAWRTRLRLGEATEIPGRLLGPGEYIVRVVDTREARTIVQFCDASETRVIATVVALPEYFNRTAETTRFVYFQRSPGAPPALRSWIYPGNDCGIRFLYPAARR